MTRAKYKWLRICFRNWTTSYVQTEAWLYREDFKGFCHWFVRKGG